MRGSNPPGIKDSEDLNTKQHTAVPICQSSVDDLMIVVLNERK